MKGHVMQSAYSWCGTRLHLVLEDDLAAAYNRAFDAFIEAQKHHLERTGTKWEPTEPLLINWTDDEQSAWDKIARIINLLAEVNDGLDISQEEMTSDYLIKL